MKAPSFEGLSAVLSWGVVYEIGRSHMARKVLPGNLDAGDF